MGLKNKKVLGLDLGTNSIGWALLEYEENDKLHSILGSGSRIVPLDPKLKDNFETGNKVSKSGDRRQKRGARRQNHRFKMRRNKLLSFARVLGVLAADFPYPWKDPEAFQASPQALDIELLTKPVNDLQLYALRTRAQQEAVSLKEFARVLFHLNQRRGYNPNRAERKNSKQKEKDQSVDYGYFTIVQVQPTGEVLNRKEQLEIELSNGEKGTSTDSQFLQLINQTIPVKIQTKENRKKEKEITFSIISTSDEEWEDRIGAMESELKLTGATPGIYFYNKLKESKALDKDYRIRERLIFRKRYLREFEAIWEVQSDFHKELSDPGLLARVIDSVMPKKSPEKGKWKKRSLKEFVRDYILYYQRPLKTQKFSIGKCQFEPSKRVIPKSHPLFQEYKLWQQVSNLKIEDAEGNSKFPSGTDLLVIFHELQGRESLSPAQVAKFLGVKKDQVKMPDNLSGHQTRVLIKKAAAEAGIDMGKLEGKLELIWQILYSLEQEEDETIARALHKNVGIPLDKTEPFTYIYFDKEYGNLSARALKKVLPLMRMGEWFSVEEIRPEVTERIEKLINGEAEDTLQESIRTYFEDKSEIEEFSGLPAWAALSLVYGSHSQKDGKEPYEKWEEIELLPLHSLRNPVVEQVINETLQVVRAVWRQYGKPDQIHLEMAREMKQNAKQRARTSKNIRSSTKKRAEIKKILQNEFKLPKPTRKDIERYRLWEDAKCQCIYTGRNIQKTSLFNGETDVDHIIPRQRYFDDSYQNKVLTFRTVNGEKGKQTAYEYMQKNGWDIFEKRVKENENFTQKKKYYLLTTEIPNDFINRQLQETRYISVRVREELERICPPYQNDDGKKNLNLLTTTGTVTDYLKNLWDLNEVYKQSMISRFQRLQQLADEKGLDLELIRREEVKNNGRSYKLLRLEGFSKRIDHRHHALDAMVVAATTRSNIQRLNNLHQYHEKRETLKRSARKIPLPHPDFREMVLSQLEEMVVSQKARTRLITHKKANFQRRNAAGKLEQVKMEKSAPAVRGQLHNETVYGKKFKRYLKIPVQKAFDNIDVLAVPWQKDKILERISEFDGNLKKAKSSVKKKKLTDLGGEAMESVTIFEEYYRQRVSLSSITPKQIKNIVATDIRQQVEGHLAQYKGDLKEAFSKEGLLIFNQNRKKPVQKVTVSINAGLRALQPDSSNPRNVDLSNNYAVWIKEDPAGKRTTEIISFFEAVEAAMEGTPLLSEVDGTRSFFLKKGESVYVMLPGESPDAISWENRGHIARRVYVLKKLSGNRFYFLPHTTSEVLNSSSGFPVDEFGSQNRTEFVDEDSPKTKIIERCIKVKVDRLGNVTPFKGV